MMQAYGQSVGVFGGAFVGSLVFDCQFDYLAAFSAICTCGRSGVEQQ